MPDTDEDKGEKPFFVDRAKTGRAACKKCKEKIAQGELRFAKIGHNPFGDGNMKMWHHIPCVFEVFKKQRATTKKIESPNDIGGWFDLSEDDREEIMSYFSPELKDVFTKFKCATSENSNEKNNGKRVDKEEELHKNHKDMTFRAFKKLCAQVGQECSYNEKSNIIRKFFTYGSDGISFKGDVELWCRLLLPGVVKRIYNLRSKQLIKIFSRIFGTSQEEMLEDLEKGDISETISKFFEQSPCHQPSSKSTLTLEEVDKFLQTLSGMTKEDEQIHYFTKFIKKCTANDLKMVIRLINGDLRICAGAKHILNGLHPDAYEAFQTSRDIRTVVADALAANSVKNKQAKNKASDKGISVDVKLMTPVLPMLAQACKSIESAMKKLRNGVFSEIKYDGERVQLHKKGNTFKYFSRSLKPVLDHKVKHLEEYIPKAFPHGKDMILDAEILMVNRNGDCLPFGTLGIHKKNAFKDANVCLFVFDCIYYNGKSLLNEPITKRKEILEKNMIEIKNHIMFSKKQEIHNAKDLKDMLTNVLRLKLEGLVLKDLKSTYEPGKRHWLKMKKDYLFEGAIADSADLVVLGAWFGTGNKGGMMSIFLMGCYDEQTKTWRTVTKVHSGHDDSTLEKLQTELDMVKISGDCSKVPKWLKCTSTMIPDFVAKDPFNMPVWEITGAEFTRNQVHSADGISIRFPRVTKIRHDKDWTCATNLSQLKDLYEASKDNVNLVLDGTRNDDSNTDEEMKEDISVPKVSRSASNSTIGSPPKKAKLTIESDPYDADTTDEDNTTESSTEDVINNPLPDIFVGCVIQMPPKYKENDFLRRYLIGYGGLIYDQNKNSLVENSKNKVTHVVHIKHKSALVKEEFWIENVRHVHVNWLWDSIKLLERQKEEKYTVTCK